MVLMQPTKERCMTLGAAAVALSAVVIGLFAAANADGTRHSLEFVVFATVCLGLLYGSLVYQLARERYLARSFRHVPPERSELEAVYTRPVKPLAILIPSYKEEERVLLQTVISAALVEYPERRIVVLLDD